MRRREGELGEGEEERNDLRDEFGKLGVWYWNDCCILYSRVGVQSVLNETGGDVLSAANNLRRVVGAVKQREGQEKAQRTHDIFSSIRDVKEAFVVYVSDVSTASKARQLPFDNQLRRRTHDLNHPSSVKDSCVALSLFQ